jgi:hypothetical protein
VKTIEAKAVKTITVGEVWQAFREAENEFRYYGDVMLGLIEATGGDQDLRVHGLRPQILRELGYAPNRPPCPTPPKCYYDTRSFKGDVMRVAGFVKALSEAVDSIVADLPPHIKRFSFYRTACVGRRPTGAGGKESDLATSRRG